MNQLKIELFKKQLKGVEVARRAEVAPETMSRIINGKQMPGFKRGQSAERIAEAVGWTGDVHDLFKEAEGVE